MKNRFSKQHWDPWEVCMRKESIQVAKLSIMLEQTNFFRNLIALTGVF